MNTEQFHELIETLFVGLLNQSEYGEEFAFYTYGPECIHRIGYATNMTPEIIEQAAKKKVDLIVTHHDAWDFVFGMKEECHRLLASHGISHFFVHLPLDYVEFGTCTSLFKAIGIDHVIQKSIESDGRSLPGIGEFEYPISFQELSERVSTVLGETIKSWKNSEKLIKRVGMITGAGNSTKCLRDAHYSECDVYITGEKVLYTIQYAKFIKMNLIVGSHTFTEIFGVRSLVEKMKANYDSLDIIELVEDHVE
ncbi:Nif3-like dinuclear metal center hexameric protein [Paenibacillus qinlingensis]|uniref:GTP cyclohydrolase 1 type 2 homolog n=1 Tax=Paenibacillus qinlingensis TaxID=1837343 RepID=A0ABU1NYM4_9BACL|nr:Nif3-like dinuclear metal center hexameric protein [Paenibacillus qinlingensis]MDR6552600.1 putative NIF3 family GTP cyclohydrolase 1 type 2 [Paenibacillus qinlingensis]